MMIQPRHTFILGLALLCVMPAETRAQQGTEALARQLVEIRGQVDELQTELNLKREEHKNRMAFLTAQQTELEASRNREVLRLHQLERELAAMREQVATAGDTSEALAPAVLRRLGELREQVRKGFPFKVHERVAELNDIESQLTGGVITAQRAFNRLWAFIEDELRISRENAIYTQAIQLAGDDVLVDMAKLGNAMLYFRTRSLRYGRAVDTGSGWRFELLESPAEQEMIAKLFDSLRKQIRQGYFELPNALPARLEVSP